MNDISGVLFGPVPVEANDAIYDAIKRSIVDGEYAGGEYLREIQLAQRYGVSRTPIREALRRLGAEGWLEVKANVGARVITWSQQDAEEIFEARLLIEPYLVGRAATRIDAKALAEIKRLAIGMLAIAQAAPTTDSLEHWFAANRAFHDILTASSGNARLDRALKQMKEVPLIKWTFTNYSHEDRERSARHHLEIVEALEHRDAQWAEAIVRCHIRAAQLSVAKHMQPAPDA